MALSVTIDSSDLGRVAERLALLTEKNVRFAVANAMKAAGAKAQDNLYQSAQQPRFIDKPTRWTLGGIQRKPYVSADRLQLDLGFMTESKGRGSPAGRYVNPIAAGTGPHLKRADLSASKIAGRRGVLIPARSAGLVDGAGNVPLRKQAQILSAARTSSQGIFIAPVRRGSSTMAIFERRTGFMRRSNTLERTTRRLFTIEPNPKTRRRQFPVRDLVEQSFAQAWRREMATAFEAELQRAMGR